MPTKQPSVIDNYITGFPDEVQQILSELKTIIKQAIPAAEETIHYAMPAFKYNGKHIIYFAAYKKHIGIYPVPAGDEKFQKEIAPYRKSKATLQLSLDNSLPESLIIKMVKFRMAETLKKVKA